MLFSIALRLHVPVDVIEGMSNRQIMGWIEMFTSEAIAESGAMEYGQMSKADLKAAFK